MAKIMTEKGSIDNSVRCLKTLVAKTATTIVSGSLVAIDAGTGTVIPAVDAQATKTVIGVAVSAVTSADAGDTIVVDVNPSMIYEMDYEGAGTVLVGVRYDLGANAYTFDSADVTGGYIVVIGNIDTTNKRADVLIPDRIFST